MGFSNVISVSLYMNGCRKKGVTNQSSHRRTNLFFRYIQ